MELLITALALVFILAALWLNRTPPAPKQDDKGLIVKAEAVTPPAGAVVFDYTGPRQDFGFTFLDVPLTVTMADADERQRKIK